MILRKEKDDEDISRCGCLPGGVHRRTDSKKIRHSVILLCDTNHV